MADGDWCSSDDLYELQSLALAIYGLTTYLDELTLEIKKVRCKNEVTILTCKVNSEN